MKATNAIHTDSPNANGAMKNPHPVENPAVSTNQPIIPVNARIIAVLP